jgi:hypothetical protein
LGQVGQFFKFVGGVASKALFSVASLVFLSSDTQNIDPTEVTDPAAFEKHGKIKGQKADGSEVIQVDVSGDLNKDGKVDEQDTDQAADSYLKTLQALGGKVINNPAPGIIEGRIEMPGGTIVQWRKAANSDSGVTSIEITYPTPRTSSQTKNGKPFEVNRIKVKLKPKP